MMSALAMSVAAVMVAGTGAAHAAEVKVMATNALKGAVLELIAAFEESSGHKVTTIWGGTEAVAKRIGDGDVVDIVIIAAPNIDTLIAERRLAAGSRAEFAKSGVGIAVRAGLPRPDISSPGAVKEAVVAAKSVAYSSGPSGYYVAEVFLRSSLRVFLPRLM